MRDEERIKRYNSAAKSWGPAGAPPGVLPAPVGGSPVVECRPPFLTDAEFEAALETKPASRNPTPTSNLVKLKALTKRAEKLRAAVRDDAFDDWIRRYLIEADEPKEWTQSAILYANYLKRAKEYGSNRRERALAKLELATDTRFGILMRDAGFIKKRRARGWYYPLRLKRGA